MRPVSTTISGTVDAVTIGRCNHNQWCASVLHERLIQRENFLEAEDIKRRLQALRVEQANREAAAIAESRTSSNNSDGSANQDDLTPLFLRRRSQRRRLELPENFLRSPAFRHQIIQNKILASDVALKIHDEMQREQVGCFMIDTYPCRRM